MCDATASPLTRAIESTTCRGDIPGSIMGIHRGVYWPRMMLEDCHCGCPNAETALAPLRALLYRIVLPSMVSGFIHQRATQYVVILETNSMFYGYVFCVQRMQHI